MSSQPNFVSAGGGWNTTNANPVAGYVYLVGAEGLEQVKIGCSQDPEERLDRMRTDSPVCLYILARYWAEDMFQEERWWHEVLTDLRLHGEWFYLPQELFEKALWLFTRYGGDDLKRQMEEEGIHWNGMDEFVGDMNQSLFKLLLSKRQLMLNAPLKMEG